MLELKELARLVRELAQDRAELHELKRELNKDYTAEDLRVMDELDAEAAAAALDLEAGACSAQLREWYAPKEPA